MAALWQAVPGAHQFGHGLVHAHRRGQHSRPYIGHVGHFQQPLNGAVLAHGAVNQGEHNSIGFGEYLRRGHSESVGIQPVGKGIGQLGQPPLPRPGDTQRHHLEAVFVGRGGHMTGRDT